MDEILHRIPALRDTEIRQIVNGPESFTPDGLPLLGEAPEVLVSYLPYIIITTLNDLVDKELFCSCWNEFSRDS